jgi:salicylate hydroxylase
MEKLLVVGGGMAGLGAALVAARAGLHVTLLEQATRFAEVGAGIQLGPNAMRVLHDWGLGPSVHKVAAFPSSLQVRDAASGRVLGRLALGEAMQSRYGQPYATIHRADLHALLLAELGDRVQARLGERVDTLVDVSPDPVRLTTASGLELEAEALLGCDGLWSRVREHMLRDGGPVYSGDLAYRGMVRMTDLPQALRRNEVTAWLGPRLHAVQYPVRAGEWLNVVVVVEGPLPVGPLGWDHEASADDLTRALGAIHPDFEGVLRPVSGWRLWPLKARAPMRGPQEQAQGRLALLGDAAHPMRPYLAQGAAMALEDAWTLGRLLAQEPGPGRDWPRLLQALAKARWQRNARVQAQSRRNGLIFHARGPMRWGRDLAMATLGEGLLDQPWLYGGPPPP